MSRRNGPGKWITAGLVCTGSLYGCFGGGGDGDGSSTAGGTMQILSSRPDTIVDGSALVQVSLPAGVQNFQLNAAGKDVSGQFKSNGAGTYVGLIEGLPLGASTLELKTGPTSVTQKVTNYSKNGPIFSGPQQTPWVCETDQVALPDGSNLGAAVDAACNAPTKVMYVYKPKTGTNLVPLPSTTSLPTDVDTTTTTEGKTVPFIVRVETGTINRAIYQYSVIFDPAKEKADDPFGTHIWNKKIVYVFGGSAQAGYHQGTFRNGGSSLSGQPSLQLALSKGFAVLTSTLNVLGNNANDVLSAESAMMTKQKFVKSFGVPIYTMGWGGSGGSMQQHLIANNYPGILDGITPRVSFPDLMTMVPQVADCSLLDRAFQASSQNWTDAQKTTVSGYGSFANCNGPNLGTSWESVYSPDWIVPTRYPGRIASYPGFGTIDLSNCMAVVGDALVYNPQTNPGGARCDLYSNQINLFGIDPGTTHAARAVDNVGVQYGLKALQTGAISAEQFVELNEKVGGYDAEGRFQQARTVASPIALENGFAYGRFNGFANLANVPIIDFRHYQDLSVDVHDSVRSLVNRARLNRATSSSANHVILRGPDNSDLSPVVLSAMDQWMSSIAKDTASDANQAAKVVRNKPADLVDACYADVALTQKVAEVADINNGGQCGALYPFHGDPRLAAGEPLTHDVEKCQLKPLNAADYPTLSGSQFARLSTVFAGGVCDYSKPSVGSQALKGTWLSYPTPGTAVSLTP